MLDGFYAYKDDEHDGGFSIIRLISIENLDTAASFDDAITYRRYERKAAGSEVWRPTTQRNHDTTQVGFLRHIVTPVTAAPQGRSNITVPHKEEERIQWACDDGVEEVHGDEDVEMEGVPKSGASESPELEEEQSGDKRKRDHDSEGKSEKRPRK